RGCEEPSLPVARRNGLEEAARRDWRATTPEVASLAAQRFRTRGEAAPLVDAAADRDRVRRHAARHEVELLAAALCVAEHLRCVAHAVEARRRIRIVVRVVATRVVAIGFARETIGRLE